MPESYNIDKLRSALADKYEIVKLIASGGMGEIYLGIHRVLGKQRAIKIIHQSVEKEKDIRQRFLQEARHAASVDHPGIIQIMDFGSHAEFDYLIMPYIEGITLREKMDDGPLDPETALELMIAMTEAIAHTHKQNIIHRDIKPSNFMINSDGRIILTDFGISKNLGDPNMTATNMILGSPKFMSPEQISGKPVDKRSDLYALGMIFYQMVSGSYPFETDDMASLAYKQVHETPPPPITVNPHVPKALNKIIVKLLEKHPDDRYPDGDALLEDLYLLKGQGLTENSFTPSAEKRSVEEMATRLVTRGDIETPQKSVRQKSRILPFISGQPESERNRKKRVWLISAIGICMAGLIVALLNFGTLKRHWPMVLGEEGSELGLRDKEIREKEILRQLETNKRPLMRDDIRELCRLKIGVKTAKNNDQRLTADLSGFLAMIPFVRYFDKGGYDMLITLKDHALGKKLVITSNLYECQHTCGEEFNINTENIPFDKIESLIKRNYCFNLFKTLSLVNTGKGRPAMSLDIPGKFKDAFIIGEQVQFCLEPDFKAHTMLLDVNIEGIFKLFPLDRNQRDQIVKNETGCSKKIQVSPPMGNEMIVALGCGLNGIMNDYSRQFDPGMPVFSWSYEATAQNSAINMSENLFKRLMDQPADKWAVNTRFIRVLNNN